MLNYSVAELRKKIIQRRYGIHIFFLSLPHNRSKHLTMKMKKLSFLLFLTLQMGMAQAQEKLVALSFDDGPTQPLQFICLMCSRNIR